MAGSVVDEIFGPSQPAQRSVVDDLFAAPPAPERKAPVGRFGNPRVDDLETGSRRFDGLERGWREKPGARSRQRQAVRTQQRRDETSERVTESLVQALTPPKPTIAESFDRGMAGLRATIDLLPYGLERGTAALIGQDSVDAINRFAADKFGMDPAGSVGELGRAIEYINSRPADPTLAQAGQNFEEADSTWAGILSGLKTIASNPGSIPNILAEAAPSMVLGGGAGAIGARAVARPVVENLAVRVGANAALAGRVAATGAGFNTGTVIANAGPNVANRFSDPTLEIPEGTSRLAAAVAEGVRQTGGQIPAAAASGAALPVAPFSGRLSLLGNVATQGLIQGAGQIASVEGGNDAIGRETAPAERFAAGAGGALFAPIDVAIRAYGTRRAAQMEADFMARQGSGQAERAAAEVHGAFDEAPFRRQNETWAETADGALAGNRGRPVAFKTPREAAEFAAKNDLGGDFELEAWGANSERVILRRRPRDAAPAQPEEAPPPAAEPEAPASVVDDIFGPAKSEPVPQPEAPAPVAVEGVRPPAPPPSVQGAAVDGASPAADRLRPEPGPLGEGEQYVATPAGNRVRTRFEVVDSRELKAAEGELQNRDRSRASTELQIQDIIAKFDPTRLGESGESDRGAPIVGPDGIIESGNGRRMVLDKIYEEHPDKAQAYKDFLISQGHNVDGLDRPVLIRRRVSEFDDEQRRQFVIDSNRDAKLELTPTERARSDADGLDGETLALYRGGDISKAENAPFVMAFQKRLPAGEQGAMIDGNQQISQAGIKRIENAMMARAYESPEILEKLLEARDNNIRSIGGALLDQSAGWARLRASIREGRVKPEYDVTERLVEAARIVSDARSNGTKIGDLLSQQGMFGDIDPVTEQFVRAFYNSTLTKAASRERIADVLDGYVRRASEQTTAPRLFAVPSISPTDIVKALLADRDGLGSGSLFGAPEGTPPESIAAEDRAPAPRRRAGVMADAAGRVGPVAPETAGEAAKPSNLMRRLSKIADDDLQDGADTPDYSKGRELADAGPYDPSFLNESFTSRTSIYDSAAIAAGIEPDKFRLLPAPRQVALLRKVMLDTFGVEVTVHPGMQERFAIDQMLDAYQNVRGMAHVLGVPLQGISLDRSLKLELRKSANYLGVYNSGTVTITLPGRSNSFAHEWGHALDFHLLRTLGDGAGKGFTGAIRGRGEKMADGALAPSRNVREAFIDLLNVMFFDKASLAAAIMDLEKKIAATKAVAQKAKFQAQIDNIKAGASQRKGGRTGFYRGAQQFDGPGGDYWTSPTEMFARAFEAYVSHRAEINGLSTEFIGKGDAAYLSMADERFAKTFPKGAERELIFAAFDVVFQQIAAEGHLGKGAAPRPDVVTTKRGDLAGPPQSIDESGWFRRMIGNELGAFEDFFTRRAKAADGRPRSPKTIVQKAQDVVSFYGYGLTARMKMIGRRHKSPTIKLLHDMITHNTGSGAFTGRGLLQAIELRQNRYVNTIDRILERHGFPRKTGGVRKELTIDEARTLRDLLISEKVEDAPENLVKAAAALRRLSDEIFYDLQRAGIDVGYTRNGYLARMLDLPKIEGDNGGFLEQAGAVYEIVFDNRFGGEASAVLGNDELLADFLRLARHFAKIDPDVDPGPVLKLIKSINQLSAKMKDSDDPDAIQAKVDKLSVELEEAVGELYDPLKAAFARASADDWLTRIQSAAPDEFDKRGPSHDFTNKRELPPEADKLLERYYINDPIEVMSTYASQAARRMEYASRFGQDSAKLKKMYDRMAVEGVPTEAINDIQRIVTLVTGRNAVNLNPTVNSFISAIQVIYGTVALLPRAVFSSLAESLTAGIVTGNPKYGIATLANLVEGALGTAKAKERREIARFVGIVQAHGGHEILANRFGGTYGGETMWDRVAGKMFYKSGLVALTRAQRTHLIGPAHAFLDALAGRILKGLEARKRGGNGEPDTSSRSHKDMQEAIARMKELGIRDPELFSRELRSTGRLPTIDELSASMDGENAYAFDWITAVSRMIDQVIQNPTPMDRPEAASGGWMGRLAYGIMSFNYAFYRNVLKGSLVRVMEQAKRGGAAYATEKAVLGLLPAAALLLLGQTITSTIREYLTNRKRWEERKKEGTLNQELIWLGITRTFGTPVDPVVQGLTGLKYQRDLTAVPLGPALGNMAQNAQAVLTPLAAGNSPNTNTSEYNMLKGAYRLGISPWAGAAMSAAPGGPLLSGATGVGTGFITSPVAADEFATMFVGPKGEKTDKPMGDWGGTAKAE